MAGKFAKSMTTEEAKARLGQGGEHLQIVDVREIAEWEDGHIEGSISIPLGELSRRHAELDGGRETLVVCRSGNRSGLACELLESLGYDVINLTGGLLQWRGNLVASTNRKS
ncbi:rhodanese-like domain-containing protein [Paenibacillus methanolicus]|uniref:Rhodanese-related sulfurtransferase n=1 Tax=Paenibacillus methanolicus TaxID=582686 RepID=A0A5S5BS59_9BACL|nr:rhodanese-like domain-containing protein [Paenibacillus methanolicus]TYP70035.1 rhodanese-related sulfurtransferase [Paenibacillus methanolicus]